MVHATPLAAWSASLLHREKNVRIEAALELGKLADPAAVPVLVSRLGVEPDFFVGENVVWALVRIGAPSVLPVIAVFQRGAPAARVHAAHALGKLGDARAVPALLAGLRDDDAAVVQKVVCSLGTLRDVRALPPLVAMLAEGGGSGELRGTLSDAVAAFGVAAVPALASLLDALRGDRAGVAVRVEVVEILGQLGVEAAVAPLAAALEDVDWEVRFAAVNALRRVDDAGVVHLLAPLLRDGHPHVSALAARVVRELT
ncbi:MAG: HEAT repeat domain-containing protein [Gemmatimonadaceae bacterium]|nr:HEAT repeat domain-containing protein [Gemmatimonadaceae bacterium]